MSPASDDRGRLTDAVIVAAVRTPFGRHGGALAGVRPDDLAAYALRALLERAAVDPADVDEVFLGCANQAGEDNRDVARMAGLLAGFPDTVPGVTVNRLCGSGLEAVAQAARAVMVGDADVVVAGGVESMSRAPWVVPKPAREYPTGSSTLHDTTLGWRLVNPRMEALGHTDPLGVTAETLAEQYGISREEQDAFALSSQAKAQAAAASGRLAAEIIPVDAPAPRGQTVLVEADEAPRADTTLESLARLRPAFAAGGTVTAGNSSGLNDGAAAVLITSRAAAARHGLPVLATIRALATAGVAPRVMGLGPVPATAEALRRAGLALDDIDLVELNEAFAAQALAVLREWGLAADDPRLNVNGGAIALGHPLGASGARLVTTLVHELGQRPAARYALATMCIGVGQGIAVVLEAAR
jgi:3-oxoadipyl-CoA thiolase